MLTAVERAELDAEVRVELHAGNWPDCPFCDTLDNVAYVGLVTDVPTFLCRGCGAFYAMDLKERPE